MLIELANLLVNSGERRGKFAEASDLLRLHELQATLPFELVRGVRQCAVAANCSMAPEAMQIEGVLLICAFTSCAGVLSISNGPIQRGEIVNQQLDQTLRTAHWHALVANQREKGMHLNCS